jgi:hypothetical protein
MHINTFAFGFIIEHFVFTALSAQTKITVFTPRILAVVTIDIFAFFYFTIVAIYQITTDPTNWRRIFVLSFNSFLFSPLSLDQFIESLRCFLVYFSIILVGIIVGSGFVGRYISWIQGWPNICLTKINQWYLISIWISCFLIFHIWIKDFD